MANFYDAPPQAGAGEIHLCRAAAQQPVPGQHC